MLTVSCVNEVEVIDHSFEFIGEIVYDDLEDQHRLTLTRKTGAQDNKYKIAFTLDGESTLTLTDHEGTVYDGSMEQTFNDVSAITYNLSRATPGEHLLKMDISSEHYSQTLEIPYTVEDFSFKFGAGITYDDDKRTYSLEVTLLEGEQKDRYTIAYSIDKQETVKSYEDIFSKDIPRSYLLSDLDPGEHTIHLTISTRKHQQTLDVPFTVAQEKFLFEGKVVYEEKSSTYSLEILLKEGRADDIYTVSYNIDTDQTALTVDEKFKIGTPRTYRLEEKDPGEHVVHVNISTPKYTQTLDVPYVVIQETFRFEGQILYDEKADTHSLQLTLVEGRDDEVYTVSYNIDSDQTAMTVDEKFSLKVPRTYCLETKDPGKHTVHVKLSSAKYSQSLDVPYTVIQETFRFEGRVLYDEKNDSHSLQVTLIEGKADNVYTVSYAIDHEQTAMTADEIFSVSVPRVYALKEKDAGEHTVHLKIATKKYTQTIDIPYSVAQRTFRFEGKVLYDEPSDSRSLQVTLLEGRTDDIYNVSYSIDHDQTSMTADERFAIGVAKTYPLKEKDPGEHTVHLKIATAKYSQSLDIPYTVAEQTFRFECSVLFDENTKEHSLKVELKEGRTDKTYTVSYMIDNEQPKKSVEEVFSNNPVRTYALPAKAAGNHTVSVTLTNGRIAQTMDIPYTVKDYSFNVKAEVEYDSTNLSHKLYLTLLSGSRDETYTISYTVDGGYSVKLINASGKELGASFTESFKDATVRSYAMSSAAKGSHTLKMTISTADYSQEITLTYNVVAIPFAIHAEMDTSGSSSVMMLTLKSGDTATSYNATIQVDGKTVSSPTINFSNSPIYKYNLGTIRPGSHSISVQLTDTHTTEKTSISYTEPVRHKYLDVALKYNNTSGKIYAEVGDNPYGIELKFVTTLTLKGQATICTSTYEYYSSDITYETKTKTMSDSNTVSGVYTSNSVNLFDKDALVSKLTSYYELSNVMEYMYDPGYGGEDSGREWWEKTGTQRVYYSIKDETLKIDVTGEKCSGVTLRIKNQIGALTLNGKTAVGGSQISITL